MSPSEVTSYLDALRAGRCMSAELVLPNGVTIRAVFAPEPLEPADPADAKWPDWKGDPQ